MDIPQMPWETVPPFEGEPGPPGPKGEQGPQGEAGGTFSPKSTLAQPAETIELTEAYQSIISQVTPEEGVYIVRGYLSLSNIVAGNGTVISVYINEVQQLPIVGALQGVLPYEVRTAKIAAGVSVQVRAKKIGGTVKAIKSESVMTLSRVE